jgi:hypothetical protein
MLRRLSTVQSRLATSSRSLRHGLKRKLAESGWVLERYSQERIYLRGLDAMERPIEGLLREINENDVSRDLFDFIVHHQEETRARSYDDLFGWWALSKTSSPFFLDVGCWNPTYLNNTFVLESQLGWDGLIVEASSYWWSAIECERSAELIRAAVVPERLRGVPLTIEASGASSAQVAHRGMHSAGSHSVQGLPLRDLVDRIPQGSDGFLSLDVEGSEVDMLSELILADTRICALSVEVLSPVHRAQLQCVLEEQGYARLLPALSRYNQWYVRTTNFHPRDLG